MEKTCNRTARVLGRGGFSLYVLAGVGLMVWASASYVELGRAHPFFLEKLPLARPDMWLGALYVHVATALLSLPACLLLQGAWLRRRAPGAHRLIGRLTGLLVLSGVVPTGMYLACFARGGLPSVLGFWLTGAITWLAMVGSIGSARARDLRAHRRLSMHVTAQLSVAVSSRLLLVCAELLGVFGDWVYVAALWLPVVGGALLVEWMIGAGRSLTSKGVRHEELLSGGAGLGPRGWRRVG